MALSYGVGRCYADREKRRGKHLSNLSLYKGEHLNTWTLCAQLDLVAVSVVSYHIPVLGNSSDQNCNVWEKVGVGERLGKSLLT